MSHSPIQFIQSGLAFQDQICFTHFTAEIHFAQRIALMGKNGSGKSSLLKILAGKLELSEGLLQMPPSLAFAYVPQKISDFEDLSGGECLSRSLNQAFNKDPALLLMDEPTNHLDRENRRALFRRLERYRGTLILASHDIELVENFTETLWFFESGEIQVFHGLYSDFIRQKHTRRQGILKELDHLKFQEKQIHENLMQEQKRAANSRKTGEKNKANRKVLLIQANTQKSDAQKTSGKKKADLRHQKEALKQRLSHIRIPEVIRPFFSLDTENPDAKTLLTINDGSAGYDETPILSNIHFSIRFGQRIALQGANGSGKSTFIKAVLAKETLWTKGTWLRPKTAHTGYLDQRYANLNPRLSVIQTLEEKVPHWSHAQIRDYLLGYLFKTNHEVSKTVEMLSEGEKARLSLAALGIQTPSLLILDELTNNLDLETKEHVIQVISQYPGALIVISHDETFLSRIRITDFYETAQGTLNQSQDF